MLAIDAPVINRGLVRHFQVQWTQHGSRNQGILTRRKLGRDAKIIGLKDIPLLRCCWARVYELAVIQKDNIFIIEDRERSFPMAS